MNVKKKSILIVEYGTHIRLLTHLFSMFEEKYYASICLNSRVKHHKDSESLPSNLSISFCNQFYFFFSLIFYARKYDYIYIATGPDSNHFSELFNVFFFYLYCVIHGKKTILTMKNPILYIDVKFNFLNFLRYKSIGHVHRFTAETRTIINKFGEKLNRKDVLLAKCHTLYSDLVSMGVLADNNNIITIGLLGTINPYRRDYDLIINVLKKLKEEKRVLLKFVRLGGMIGKSSHTILEEISRYADIDRNENDWINRDQFDRAGKQCSILISTLNEDRLYGVLKGSGSFGDAIYFKIPLIIPSHCDPCKEFSDISIYYKNENQLLDIFNNIDLHSKRKISDKFIDEYSTKNILSQMESDLKL